LARIRTDIAKTCDKYIYTPPKSAENLFFFGLNDVSVYDFKLYINPFT